MWLKIFRIRKLQTFMMAVIILLCAVMIGSSVSVLVSLSQPYYDLAKECQSPETLVYTYSYKEEDILKLAGELEKIPKVNEVICVNKHYLTEEFSVNGKIMDCFSNLTEYNDQVFKNVRYVEGSRDTALHLQEGECVIPACISNEYGVRTGDSISVIFSDKTVLYTVKGIYTDPYSSSAAYDSYIFINKLPEQVTQSKLLVLNTDEDLTTSEIEEIYQDTYHTQFPGQFHSLKDAIDGALLASRILGAILLGIGVVMLAVSCLIINFIVKSSMYADAKTIAVYKTMGYRTRDILKMYLLFYLAVTTIAVFLGIFFSKFFAEAMLRQMYQNIGLEPEVKMLGIGVSCYLLITGMILATVYLIIRKTRRVKPVDALNGMSSVNTGRKKMKEGGISGSFSPLGIALRFALRDKRGLVGILITSMVSVVGMNFAIVSLDIANAMKENNDYWLGIDKSQVMITLTEGTRMQDLEDLIHKDARVKQAVPCALNLSIVNLDWKKGMEISVMYPFVYENYDDVGMDVTIGRNPSAGDEIAIASKMAEVTQKEVGDYIDITVAGTKSSYFITGIYQTYYNMGKNCRLTTQAYENLGKTEVYDTLSIYLEDGTDTESYIEEIGPLVSNMGKVQLRSEQFSSIMNLIMKPQQSAIPPMTVLILFIGGANIFCIILLKNTKESKINCIYKCIGYSTSHLIKANVIYVSVLAAVSIAIAVPICIVTYPQIMMLSLSTFNLIEYQVRYQPLHIAAANGAIFAVFLICTLASSRSLRKVHVRDLVIE